MNNKTSFLIILSIFVILIGMLVYFLFTPNKNDSTVVNNSNIITTIPSTTSTQPSLTPAVAQANPASENCSSKGGNLEIITNNDGSQFGMCVFSDYSCEEWALFNNECNITEDAELIKQKLVNKGLNLTGMKVVINKHLGKFMAGSVVPVDTLGGGGYVFAVKENGKVQVLADGNGVIMCSAFSNYPDYPAYLVEECIDENGNSVKR